MLLPKQPPQVIVDLPINQHQKDTLLDQYAMGMALDDAVALIGLDERIYEILKDNRDFMFECKRRRAIAIGTLLEQAFDGATTAAAKGNPTHVMNLLKLLNPSMFNIEQKSKELADKDKISPESLLGGNSINFNFVMPDGVKPVQPPKERKIAADDVVVDAVVEDIQDENPFKNLGAMNGY